MVAEGRLGKVTVCGTSTAGKHTIAELKSWSISGVSRNMIDASVFGTDVKKFLPGMIDPGTIQFTGFYDGSDSTGQVNLIRSLTSGGSITNTLASSQLSRLRLWPNADASFGSYGFWSCSGSSGKIYITSIDVSINSDGLGEVTFNGKVSDGMMEWSTST